MKENNSAIITNATRKYVTIKIETDTLCEIFNDMYGNELKIKNKLQFANEFSKSLSEHLMNDGIGLVLDCCIDSDCVKENYDYE